MAATTKKASWGALTSYEGIPTLEIKTEHETGYLAPFRDYCFQVSGTVDGQWDLGSTPVFGLDTIKSVKQIGRSNLGQVSTVKYFITALAMQAVHEFCNHRGCVAPSFYHNCECEALRVSFNDWVDAVYNRYINGNRNFVPVTQSSEEVA